MSGADTATKERPWPGEVTGWRERRPQRRRPRHCSPGSRWWRSATRRPRHRRPAPSGPRPAVHRPPLPTAYCPARRCRRWGRSPTRAPRACSASAALEKWLGGTDIRVGHTYLPGDSWSDIEGDGRVAATPGPTGGAPTPTGMLVLNVPMQEHNEDRRRRRRGARASSSRAPTATSTTTSRSSPSAWSTLERARHGDRARLGDERHHVHPPLRARPGGVEDVLEPHRHRDACGPRPALPLRLRAEPRPGRRRRGPSAIRATTRRHHRHGLLRPAAGRVLRRRRSTSRTGCRRRWTSPPRHKKPISYPEWGLFRNGDNPDYMRRMLAWMDAHQPVYQTPSPTTARTACGSARTTRRPRRSTARSCTAARSPRWYRSSPSSRPRRRPLPRILRRPHPRRRPLPRILRRPHPRRRRRRRRPSRARRPPSRPSAGRDAYRKASRPGARAHRDPPAVPLRPPCRRRRPRPVRSPRVRPPRRPPPPSSPARRCRSATS